MIELRTRKTLVLGIALALLLVVPVLAMAGCQASSDEGQSTITYSVTPDATIESITISMGTKARMTSPIVMVDVVVTNAGAEKMGFEPLLSVDDGPTMAGGAAGKLVEPGKTQKLSSWAIAPNGIPQKIELTIGSRPGWE